MANGLRKISRNYLALTFFERPITSQRKNGRIDRYFKTIKDEIFHRVDVEDVLHAQELCVLYREYYNNFRPHQSKCGLPPRVVDQAIVKPFIMSKIRKIKVAKGLITRYEIAA